MNPDDQTPKPEAVTPSPPSSQLARLDEAPAKRAGGSPKATEGGPTSPNKSLSEIMALAKEKGEGIRSQPKSVDNFAKSAWKNSTGVRQSLKEKLNTAYTILTGLTHPEVRKELKEYINNVQPPTKK